MWAKLRRTKRRRGEWGACSSHSASEMWWNFSEIFTCARGKRMRHATLIGDRGG